MAEMTNRCPKCLSINTALFSDKKMSICLDCKEMFSTDISQKADIPMKIFISYGHPEVEICSRICDYLKNRGHEVWFDKDDIHHGQDWRERIVTGIESSNGVLACLSEHSVRDPGVCLDELTIAVGIKGNVIKTILLDDEDKVKPPATISHLQWLDMHDWRLRMRKDPIEYELWCKRKLYEIAQVIESKTTRDFIGKIEIIKSKLGIIINTDRQKHYLKQRFIGRKWLVEKIEDWLNDSDGDQICVLYGDPGIGKSIFAAHYSHYNARVAASIFCKTNEDFFNSGVYVIKMIAYLLACRLPVYRELLCACLEHISIDQMNDQDLFRLLLEEPLNMSVDGNHETLCIVIDGLDECGTPEKNVLAEILGKHGPLLPKWIRILVTARDVSGVRSSLHNRFFIKLTGKDKDNLSDIRTYFQEFLKTYAADQPYQEKHLINLMQKSEGIFLYGTLLMHGLKKGKLSLTDGDDLPEGLPGILHSWFTWFFPDLKEYRSVFRLPLGAILASPEPLPVKELKWLFGWDDNKLQDFFNRIDVFLQHNNEHSEIETVEFSHKYISTWLNSSENKVYYSFHKPALRYMYQKYIETASVDLDNLSEYGVRYVIPFYLVSEHDMISLKMLSVDDETDYSSFFRHKEIASVVNSHEYCMRLLALVSEVRKRYTVKFRDHQCFYGIDDRSLAIALVLYRSKYVYSRLDELIALDEELDKIIEANENYISHLKSELASQPNND